MAKKSFTELIYTVLKLGIYIKEHQQCQNEKKT